MATKTSQIRDLHCPTCDRIEKVEVTFAVTDLDAARILTAIDGQCRQNHPVDVSAMPNEEQPFSGW
jgi:hypothetical protein